MKAFDYITTECLFSLDRRYRFTLVRKWRPIGSPNRYKPGYVAFVGLNPSTADENALDPTVTRCVRFSDKWGYRRMYMLNLFAFRATNPLEMRVQADPVGDPSYFQAVAECIAGADMVVLCWGNHGVLKNRSEEFLSWLVVNGHINKCRAFAVTGNGQPGHPLYIAADRLIHPVSVRSGGRIELVYPEPEKPKVEVEKEIKHVYVVDRLGADLATDSIVAKKYVLRRKWPSGRGITVQIGKKQYQIKKIQSSRFFFSEEAVLEFLQAWVAKEEAVASNKLIHLQALKNASPSQLLQTLVRVTTDE